MRRYEHDEVQIEWEEDRLYGGYSDPYESDLEAARYEDRFWGRDL